MGIPRAQIDKPFDKLSAHPNWHWLWAIALAAIAFAFRLIPVLRGGGLFGFGNYDDGVYYAAATGLVHGRLPYRDFLLLHPPGMPLLLTPFALGAQLASDSYGFAAARVAWMLLGALNAVLIWRILRPIGLVAALFGGLSYAVFYPAVYADQVDIAGEPGHHSTAARDHPARACCPRQLVAAWPGSCRRGAARVGRDDQGLGGRYCPDRPWLVAAEDAGSARHCRC